jgi:hypothetical protein
LRALTSGGVPIIILAVTLGSYLLISLPSEANAGIFNPTLTLDPVDDTNPVGTTHTVNATICCGFAGVLTIHFNVTGANPTTGLCVTVANFTDFSNTCSFSYVGVNAGHDDITARELLLNLTAKANKEWTIEQRPVAGEIMGVDMTALLIAGAMANSYWLLPTMGTIAAAIFVIARAAKK